MARVSSSVYAILLILGTINAVYIVEKKTKAKKQVNAHPCAQWEQKVQDLQSLLDEKVKLIKNLQDTISKDSVAAAKYQKDLDEARKAFDLINQKLKDATNFLEQYKAQQAINDKAYKALQQAYAEQECQMNNYKYELEYKTNFINALVASFKGYSAGGYKHDDSCDVKQVVQHDDKKDDQHKAQNKRAPKKHAGHVGSALA